jgi:L-alanine-DL-glutamate epimerase-like enolase superfamily enzyme
VEITEIRQRHLEHELPGPFHPSWVPGGAQTELAVDLIEVETDAGLTGVTAIPSFPGGIDMEPALERVLVGEDPHEVERLLEFLDTIEFMGADAVHVEVALWDIIGQDAGKPIYRLLGGSDDPVRAYASTGAVKPVEERLETVREYVADGFEAVKLRFQSERLEDDLEVARAVRAEFPDLTLMVDANMGWSMRLAGEIERRWSLKEAIYVAEQLEEIGGVAWLEEPLGQHSYDRLAELRSHTSVPVAGGESVSGTHPFREYVDHGSLDVLQPDAVFATGILRGKKVAGLAEMAGLEFAPHTWSNGVGLAANLHLIAATGSEWCEYPLEPPGFVPSARDFMLSEPIRPDDGRVTPPDRPGLGVELDWDAIADATVDP